MKPIYLYIENFMGYEFSELDLSGFSSALIVGRVNASDLASNTAGKSTIFRALEFCIFGECDKGVKLEMLIRDDAPKCKVSFDFESDGKIYRISRTRTRKGSTDLTLFEQNNHLPAGVNPHSAFLDKDKFKECWNDISGRRTPDTEETLEQIHKLTYKAFCSGYYFSQDDHSTNLATATKTERKEILKGSLQLAIYNALYKLASLRTASLQKDIDKKKMLLDTIGNPNNSIDLLNVRVKELEALILSQSALIAPLNTSHAAQVQIVNQLKNRSQLLVDQLSSVFKKQSDVNSKISKIEVSINEYSSKRKTILSEAKSLALEIDKIKEAKGKITEPTVLEIQVLRDKLDLEKSLLSEKSTILRSNKEELVELNIPLPNEGYCKHCRQPLTDVHRRECIKTDKIKIEKLEQQSQVLSSEIITLNKSIKILTDEIKSLENCKKEYDSLTAQYFSKTKEMVDKNVLFNDYDSIFKKHKLELEEAKLELVSVQKEIENSSSKELEDLKQKISLEENVGNKILQEIDLLNKDLTKFNNEKLISEHSILEKKKDLDKKLALSQELIKLEDDYLSLLDVTEAFGPTGISNLIIQNILDDLQLEANNILEQIRPELQLSFTIEKTRGDGQLDDDLDINYFVNSKPRDYGLLSGAQKICVMFSLKIGVVYLLNKILGAKIQMLLLDELDQSLDKACIDAFSDIVKFFQKDFTILVITHNDRLKDKFSHAILVEKDQNMISKARVVTSW